MSLIGDVLYEQHEEDLVRAVAAERAAIVKWLRDQATSINCSDHPNTGPWVAAATWFADEIARSKAPPALIKVPTQT
jgi:hypothetical protein